MLATALINLSLLSVSAHYQPVVGDYVEVFRRTFRRADFNHGKSEMVRITSQAASRDGLVRKMVFGENPSTGEVLAVVFSDPYNRGNWRFKNDYSALGPYEMKPVQRTEFRIFGIDDEGAAAKPGDVLKLYWHSVKPNAHSQMRAALEEGMLKALQSDRYKANAYMSESEKVGDFLAIVIGDFTPRPGTYSGNIAHLSAYFNHPVGRDSFRVFMVINERRQ